MAEQRKVEAWRTARIARLIEQFGIESIMRWEGADNVVEVWNSLLAFGDEVLTERFSAVDDLVSRVLGGGVANRYETRLKPTVKWLTKREPDALSAFFLHAARWDREQAAKTETTSLKLPSSQQPRPKPSCEIPVQNCSNEASASATRNWKSRTSS